METYSMTQIETLTGISAHTLRIWERRYSFLKPDRTPTNIRYYSDSLLRKLLNVGILTRNGHRISKIDKMSDTEMYEHVTQILSSVTDDNKDEIDALTIAALDFDEHDFNIIFQRSVIRRGFLNTVVKLIYPFLNHIGILWGNNRAIPAQEHFISNLIRQKIIAAIDTLPIAPSAAPSIVFFLTEGENHEIGLLLASFIAKSYGWQTIYLGQNMPQKDIKHLTKLTNPILAMSILITPRTTEPKDLLKVFLKENDIPIILTGSYAIHHSYEDSERILIARDPNEFMAILERFKLNWS